jgi:hypothetical protein
MLQGRGTHYASAMKLPESAPPCEVNHRLGPRSSYWDSDPDGSSSALPFSSSGALPLPLIVKEGSVKLLCTDQFI